MPLTHDIGVRIPYPLLKTDNFGCLFFLSYVLNYAEPTITSSTGFRLIGLIDTLPQSGQPFHATQTAQTQKKKG